LHQTKHTKVPPDGYSSRMTRQAAVWRKDHAPVE
jgi:hypothetical protein